MSSTEDARLQVERGFGELELGGSERSIDRLAELAQLLFGWSKRVNLTAHRSAEAIARRLVLDAVALTETLPELASLVDIGSGAGFPGLPIAILRPKTSVVLIESRERRHHFQREAIRRLGLDNAQALLGRAEELDGPRASAAIAQAISPERALPLMVRWVVPGGLLLFPGSSSAAPIPLAPGLELVDRVAYRVPCGGPERTLSVVRRI